MQVMYGDKKGYIDGYLFQNLELYKKMVRNKRDLIFICAGREREGKSTFMNQVLKYLDPTYDLSRCCFDGDEFLKCIREAPEKSFQAIGWDEAQEFTSRSAISKFNKKMVQALSLIGIKQLYIGICIPSFFELDRYPAIHRSNFLLRVYSHQGQRGRFEFYNWEKKKNLYLRGKKEYDYSVIKKNFMGMFTNRMFPFDTDEYNKKKMIALEKGLAKEKKKPTKRYLKVINQRDAFLHYLYSEFEISNKELDIIAKKYDVDFKKDAIRKALDKYG